MISKLDLSEPQLTATRATDKNQSSSPLTVQPAGRGAAPLGAALAFWGALMKTYAYIDAVNIHFSCVRGSLPGDRQNASPVNRPKCSPYRKIPIIRFPVIPNSAP